MISVVIPLYNKEAIVERSVRSILSQDYDDFEVVVVNDGSTDKSVEIVKSIHDPRITLIEQENGGPSKARNTGVKNAKGEWIVFLDADDELLPGALGRFATTISENKDATLIACPFFFENGIETVQNYRFDKGWLKNPFKAYYIGNFFLVPGSFVCVKEKLVEYPFNIALRRYEDINVWFQLFRETKIYTISEPSVLINSRYSSASKARKDIREDFVGHLDFKGKSFWEQMCLYKLYLGEMPYYMGQIKKLYPLLKYRYDLFFLYKLLSYLNKLHSYIR